MRMTPYDYSERGLSIVIFAHSSLSCHRATPNKLVGPYFYFGNATNIAPYFDVVANIYSWPSTLADHFFLIFFDKYIRLPSLESMYYL